MSKCKWWVAVVLGLVASSGAMASEAASESAVKPLSTNERQVASISGVDSVSYMGTSTNSSQGSTSASKLPSGASYDSSIGPGPSSLPFILAGLGALAVAATRRRSR